MNTYAVTLKYTAEIVTDVYGDDLEEALQNAKGLYTTDNVKAVLGVKAKRGSYVNYEDLAVTGVQG